MAVSATLIMGAALVACALSAAAQQADPLRITAPLFVTIHSNYIQRQLRASVTSQIDGLKFDESGIKGELFCKNSTCGPDAFFGLTSNTIRAKYSFKGALEHLPDITISLNIDVHFYCWVGQPELTTGIDLNNFDVDPFFYEIIEGVLERKMQDLASTFLNAIKEEVNISNLPLPVCPHFRTTFWGDLVMNFAAGTQCQEGATQTRACAKNYLGSGKELLCQNGWWWLVLNDCDRIPPPGTVNP